MGAPGAPAATSKRSGAQTLLRVSGPVRGAIAAGALAGFVSAGIGSRVVMHIIAVLDPDHAGVLTDSRAIVGEISLGGTFSLLALGTTFGVIGGLMYLGLRRWLWVSPAWRGVIFGAVTLVTIGQLLFDSMSLDLQIFEPVGVILVLFAALFFINGLILAPLADRIHPEPEYATGRRVPRIATGLLAVVSLLGLALTVDTFRTIVGDAGTCYSAVGGGEGCAVLERNVVP
jgi:hypothetical protein